MMSAQDAAARFFATAAGPDASEIFGPPGNVLDVYADGSPVAGAEQGIAGGGGGGGPWYLRHDVHALAMLAVGVFLIHQYTIN
jgi:hypothetical protein